MERGRRESSGGCSFGERIAERKKLEVERREVSAF